MTFWNRFSAEEAKTATIEAKIKQLLSDDRVRYTCEHLSTKIQESAKRGEHDVEYTVEQYRMLEEGQKYDVRWVFELLGYEVEESIELICW